MKSRVPPHSFVVEMFSKDGPLAESNGTCRHVEDA